MDQSPTFARHFSRLVWLLMNDSGSVDEQKMSLRALVLVTRAGAVAVSADRKGLRAGGILVPAVLSGVQDTVERMQAHSVASFAITEGAGAADILGLARLLSGGPVPNDGGEEFARKLAALGATSISITPIPRAEPGETDAETVAEAATETAAVTGSALAAPAAPATSAPPAAPEPREAPPTAAAQTPAAPAAPARGDGSRQVSEAMSALLEQLSGRDVSTLPPEELLAALDSATDAGEVDAASRLLDDLATLAEHSVRGGKPKVVADVLHGIVSRDARQREELRAAFAVTIRRLSKPALLRAVAGLIVKHPERTQHCFEILQRTGEDGANALVEQVAQARSAAERRSLLDVLVELPDAVTALVRMLGDSRWFVARNAAELLGELSATKAEGALVGLLKHADYRVRRAATDALLKLGTPDAVKGVYDAVRDTSPDVRMQVAAAISTRKDARTSATLIRAIEGEADGEVQLAMIAALGKVATAEAVQKLVRMAEPEGRLFKKKDQALRVAAVQALGDAGTPAALTALKELVADKEREVRETATRALAQLQTVDRRP